MRAVEGVDRCQQFGRRDVGWRSVPIDPKGFTMASGRTRCRGPSFLHEAKCRRIGHELTGVNSGEFREGLTPVNSRRPEPCRAGVRLAPALALYA